MSVSVSCDTRPFSASSAPLLTVSTQLKGRARCPRRADFQRGSPGGFALPIEHPSAWIYPLGFPQLPGSDLAERVPLLPHECD